MTKLWSRVVIHPLCYFFLLLSLFAGQIKFVLIICIILLFHELGHIIMLKHFKRKITKITVLPFGGIISIDSYISEPIEEDLLRAVGGILFQLILGVILFVLLRMDLISMHYFEKVTLYNMILIGFNMLPLCPLDGYKMVKLLEELVIPFKKTFVISFIIGNSLLLSICFTRFNLVTSNILVFGFIILSMINELKTSKYVLNRFYLERMNHKFNFKNKRFKKIENM